MASNTNLIQDSLKGIQTEVNMLRHYMKLSMEQWYTVMQPGANKRDQRKVQCGPQLFEQ
jgi:hypothetical protein